MTTKARIQDGVVAEILTADPFPPFNPELIWVECDDTVQVGWLYDGVSFSAPVVVVSQQERWSALQAQARAMFAATDTLAIRCLKAGVAYPTEWQTCDAALRAILHTTLGDPDTVLLPALPTSKPAGI